MTASVLSCRGVVHDYDGTPALLGVDLDVAEGEVLAITGPSGSGKSTLLLCLAGILVPREGSVHLGGVDLRAVGEHHRAALRRQSVGIVFQYGTLVPELTGEENVALPLLLSGRRRAEAIAPAKEWLERLGVAEVAGTTAARMSGGSASGWPSPGRSSGRHRWCWPTSRPGRSTRWRPTWWPASWSPPPGMPGPPS